MEDNKIFDLIKNYIGDYNTQEHPFLLFDIAHVNENDHTKILLNILKYNKCQFLPCFLQALGAPEFKSIIVAPKDQEVAFGNKGTGYIDLYFKYRSLIDEEETFIIENKIYGAGDTMHQLAKYIATAYYESANIDFQDIWSNWKDGNKSELVDEERLKHIHVVYLTADGSKKPKLNSLPKYFGGRTDAKGDFDEEEMKINYYPVNYANDIISWLENDVLPNMPYSDNGIAIAGIRQYIESLKVMFNSRGNSKVIEDYANELGIEEDIDKYQEIINAMNVVKSLADKGKGKKDLRSLKNRLKDAGFDVKDVPELHSLARELRAYAMGIFANDGFELGGDWKLYFTPSFIILYKQRWADLDTRKYAIPSIYFQTSTISLLSGKDAKWFLQVDHLNNNKKNGNKEQGSFRIGNHNKTAYYQIPIKTHLEKRDSKSRSDYYKSLISNLNKYIDLVDKAVEKIYKDCYLERKFYQEKFLELLVSELDNS